MMKFEFCSYYGDDKECTLSVHPWGDIGVEFPPDDELRAVWSEPVAVGVHFDGRAFYKNQEGIHTLFPTKVLPAVKEFIKRKIIPWAEKKFNLVEGLAMSSVFADILQPEPRDEGTTQERPLTVVLTTGGALNALLREQSVTMRADGGDVVCDLTPQVRIRDAAQIAENTFVQVKVFARRVEVAPVSDAGDLAAALTLDLDELKAWAAKIFR